jgi:predicted AlkP superfamily pyrophosphatase or phosphodiesterase
MNYKFLSLNILYIIGLIFFLNGFLLTRRVILQNSIGTIPTSIPTQFKQVILIVIDALRYDFIKPNNKSINRNYLNQMPFVHQLLKTKSKQSILLRLIADPPTTTLQRLKALTTGTLPTFIDISYNFIGYEIEEDNILNQLKQNPYQRNTSLLGDDTWLALYPNIQFKHLHVYPSFDVHDLDTVDNGILKHLWRVIEDTRHEELSFIIVHFLGVDHCGHRYGPSHMEMKRKLNQMDDVIRNLTIAFDQSNSSSLLMVIGDHGMTQQGDHGGDELNEIETAMFLYTNQANYFSLAEDEEKTVSQIDLVPTLSWFLHTLIPFSSIGMMIIDIIPIEQRYIAMKLNFQQIESYLQHISLTLPLSDQIQDIRADLHTIFMSFDRQRNLTMIENLFKQFKDELQTHFRHQWSTFNTFRITIGLILMLFSCVLLGLIYFKFSKTYGNIIFSFTLGFMYFAISFSNSFIINEAMCLYFLLQTIILITKMDILQKFLLSFLLFLTRAFLICREEQQSYCIDPLWLVSKSSDTFNHFLPLMAAIAWLIIFILTCNHTYLFPYVSFLSVVAYWFNIPHALSIFYLSIIIQFCFVVLKPSRFDTLIYSILIFVIGSRFSFVIFIQYFIYYILLNNNNNHQSLPLCLSILAEYFFYATGHQPVISQIRWTAAFPTLNSPLNNYLSLIINSLFVRGMFVLIETFSGQILNLIFIRKMLQKKSQDELIKHVLIIDCLKLLITSFSVFILRRHLMLWKIFCPRFLFQLVGFIIKLLFVFLTIRLRK